MTSAELRAAYALTPSTSADTIHALRQVHGYPLVLIAAACQVSRDTLTKRLAQAGLIKDSRPGRRVRRLKPAIFVRLITSSK